ncbi:MAG: PilN domain-containing protein [Armatimonadetes bacterium]|nr:PilN domain-containing protein [Armatimonadota bacterium]
MAVKRTKHPSSIKLNLIPPYVAAARKTKGALVLTVIACLLVLGGMGLWWRTNAAEIVRLEGELQRKTQEAQVVLDLESKANSKRQEVADITNALKILDDIRKSGDEWTTITLKIAEWIPEEVRLTQMTYQGSPTNAQSVILTGYTTSVRKLRDFYSQLSQSALFSQVTLQAVDKNGVPVPVVGLPPVLPKEKPKGPEVATELAPPSQQPSTATGAPPSGPGMGMHAAGVGMHGPSGPMGGPPMTGAPMGMHGGGGIGAPPSWALGGGPMMGGPQQQQAITRDPTAPRNAVYFVILATLARPVQVASTLQPAQPTAGAAGPGAMGPIGMPEFGGPAAGSSEPAPPEATAGGAGAAGAGRTEVPEE